MKNLDTLSMDSLRDFGINYDMTTHEYVLWLNSSEGDEFLKTIKYTENEKDRENPREKFSAKGEIISRYAKLKESKLI